jgi:hypothetical protein
MPQKDPGYTVTVISRGPDGKPVVKTVHVDKPFMLAKPRPATPKN